MKQCDRKYSEQKLGPDAVDFIDDGQIHSLLARRCPDKAAVRDVIAKSLDKKALSLDETALLLTATDPEVNAEIFAAARKLKETVYGNRIVLFAPLYIGNRCINDCAYCGFKESNTATVRRTLSDTDIEKQVAALEEMGHKRLILVYGEHPCYDARFIADSVRLVYSIKVKNGSIRRVNINAPPLNIEDFKIVKDAGIGTYQIFQETYHRETYLKYHPEKTPKSNFIYRLDALSRAMQAGCDDVGIGALFGLYDWRFEVLGLVRHALHLSERFGVGPHTVSFPRFQPASGVAFDRKYIVSDNDFKKLVAVLRLAVPYTGLILTARENPAIRRELMSYGVSQIDAGSRIELGGYTEAGDAQVMEREQFKLGDVRPLDVVMRELIEDGYVPSFCTACYRLGRTGEHFMEFAIPGFIKRFCTPNALATLLEYLVDYASPETRAAGEKLIAAEIAKLPDGDQKDKLRQNLATIRTTDKRDLYF